MQEKNPQLCNTLLPAFASGTGFEVDFDLAVTRHQLIDARERSAAEERVVKR